MINMRCTNGLYYCRFYLDGRDEVVSGLSSFYHADFLAVLVYPLMTEPSGSSEDESEREPPELRLFRWRCPYDNKDDGNVVDDGAHHVPTSAAMKRRSGTVGKAMELVCDVVACHGYNGNSPLSYALGMFTLCMKKHDA